MISSSKDLIKSLFAFTNWEGTQAWNCQFHTILRFYVHFTPSHHRQSFSYVEKVLRVTATPLPPSPISWNQKRQNTIFSGILLFGASWFKSIHFLQYASNKCKGQKHRDGPSGCVWTSWTKIHLCREGSEGGHTTHPPFPYSWKRKQQNTFFSGILLFCASTCEDIHFLTVC